MFDIIRHTQGSKAWLKWRHEGIGASEADAIMGQNRWKSPKSLLREKTAPVRTTSFTNAAMERGTALEPAARALYRTRTGHQVEAACLQSQQHPWLKASVDGICTKVKRLVEIKCGDSAYEHTRRHTAPPAYYMGQLQHILAITGYDEIDFWCFLPDVPPLHVIVPRDDGYIARLLEAEAAFWSQVMAGRAALSEGVT